MLFQLLQITMLILSQTKLTSQTYFLQRNEQVKNPDVNKLCHPNLTLTFQDCCLQPRLQRSCKYCQKFIFRCNIVKNKLSSTPTEEVLQFHKETERLNSGGHYGNKIIEQITSIIDPNMVISNIVHDQMKRSISIRTQHSPVVQQEISIFLNDKTSKLNLSPSKRNIIHEINQSKQPLHKQFSSTQDMRSSLRKFSDKNRMYPIGNLNTSLVLTQDKNSNLITELSISGEQYPQAVEDVVKTDYTGSKSNPIVINLPVYRESKLYTSRLIHDSDRRRQFLSDLHRFRKEKNKLEIQRGCEKSSGHEDIKTSGHEEMKTSGHKDIKTSGCIEHKSRKTFVAGGPELIEVGIGLKDTRDDPNPPMVARVSESVQSVTSEEKLVKRWGSLGAGKFRQWWFGN